MAALRGSVDAVGGIDVRSGSKVLQTVAAKLPPALHCANKIVFPPLPTVDPDLV
ncbi:hypothetical protein [Streptomyces sp. NBC_00370]|uniref:hypothetical protein n=1 Tax=Streptomyces sp. NBC_00370 TaxID=2975728 RepID=UPI002E25C135